MTALLAAPDGREVLGRFAEAAAGDLALLARLHDREPGRELLEALREADFPDNLGLRLRATAGEQALELMRQAIVALPEAIDDETLDRLAVDFADVYLNYGVRASPYESVWLDDDGLERQEPMFQVRAYYRRHGLAAEDWSKRADDHLVLQLSFLAHLFDRKAGEPVLREAATFLDEHLLRWIDRFAGRVAGGCATPYFAALGLLSAAYVDELRDLLAAALHEPRPTPEEIEQRMRPKPVAACATVPFGPGIGPGW